LVFSKIKKEKYNWRIFALEEFDSHYSRFQQFLKKEKKSISAMLRLLVRILTKPFLSRIPMQETFPG